MTQPRSTFLAADPDPSSERPFGFASPIAPPLSTSEPDPATTPGAIAPPDDFVPPTEQLRPLEEITPAPPEQRDPSQPMSEAEPSEATTAWDPTRPLLGNATDATTAPLSKADDELSSQELGALPPPTGAPVGGTRAGSDWPWPAPMEPPIAQPRPVAPGGARPAFPGAQPTTAGTQAPYPPNVQPPNISPYPVNPYATGAYSQQGYYPAPPGANRPPENGSSTASGWLMGLLITGVVFGGLAPWTLFGAGVLAAINKVPGRVAVIVCAGFTLFVMFLWSQGYFYNDQLESTAQLLSLIGFAAVAIGRHNSQRRRF